LPLKEMNAHCVKYVKIRRIGWKQRKFFSYNSTWQRWRNWWTRWWSPSTSLRTKNPFFKAIQNQWFPLLLIPLRYPFWSSLQYILDFSNRLANYLFRRKCLILFSWW
jgi:hypothetical protein